MKTKFLMPLLLLLSIFGCQDDITDNISSDDNKASILAKTKLETLPSINLRNSGNDVKSTSTLGNYPINLSNPPRSVMINGIYHSDFKYWFDEVLFSKIPYNIKNDILEQDGWEVIYNTIREYNPSTFQGTTDYPFIGLYNRYRGIFRFFYYHAYNTEGNDVVGILALPSGNNSKILNHPTIGESYANNNTQKYMSTMGTALSSNFSNIDNGLAPNHWYCFDFDVSCYDPIINSGGLVFAITSIQRDDLELNGTINGDIIGSITGSSSSSGSLLSIGNLFSQKDETSSTTNVNLEVNSNSADAIGTTLENNANSSTASIDVKNLFKGLVKDGVTALKKGVASFMSSGISGLFSSLSSSLFGSSKPNIQQVKLHAQLELKAEGTITSKNTYSFDLGMPNKRIGLIHLNATPTVQCQESVELNPGLYSVDPNDPFSYMCIHYFRNINFNTTINPDIDNEVDIYTTSKLIFMNKNPNFDLNKIGFEVTPVEFTWMRQKLPFRNAKIVGLDKVNEIWETTVIPLRSKIFDKKANRNYQPGNPNFIISNTLGNVFIKVNYKVVPKNGSQTYYLQKTYRANVIESNSHNPFPSNWEDINDGPGGLPIGF
ncbi:hypothetical protein [Marinifilum fragile]|uniref:hypothetical protein n=1 Tax=Marinifilum fragile TaxID=570161 RepID=UPI002AA67DFF|nr:hypothetical protein [Marinifilum fragile]